MSATPQNWLAANQSNVQPGRPQARSMSRALTAPYWPKICLMPIAPTNGGRIIGMRISGGEEFPARVAETVEEEGQRQCDEQRERRRDQRQQEGISEAAQIKRVGENRAQERKGQAPVGVDKTALQDLQHRPQEEDGKKRRRGHQHNAGERFRHRARVWRRLTRAGKAEIRPGRDRHFCHAGFDVSGPDAHLPTPNYRQ